MSTSQQLEKKNDFAPRRKPVQKRALATMNSLLDSASLVLEETGLDSFSTAKVAEKAGMAIGSVYQYFPDKHSILLALVERWYEKSHEIDDLIEDINALDLLAKLYREQPGAAFLGEAVCLVPNLAEYNHSYFSGLTERVANYMSGERPTNSQDVAAARVFVACTNAILADTARRDLKEADEMLKVSKAIFSSFLGYWALTREPEASPE